MREPIDIIEHKGYNIIIEHKGYNIEIFYDDMAETPNDWGNEDAFLVYDHRNFTVTRRYFDPANIFEVFQTKNIYDGYFIYPVYAYIHGDVSLSLGRQYPFNCRWDTSFKGFALVKKQKGTYNRETSAREAAEGLIKTWNIYLSGEVYGYNSVAGSCWGFWGEEGKEDMIEEAKFEIDQYILNKYKGKMNMLKHFIKNKVSLEKRMCLLQDIV